MTTSTEVCTTRGSSRRGGLPARGATPSRVLSDIISSTKDGNPVEDNGIPAAKASIQKVPYTLNKKKTIKKQLDAANKEYLYEVTHGDNHIMVRCQPGLYELIRKAMYVYFVLRQKHGQLCEIDVHVEKASQLVCQTTVKVKSSSGTKKFTINMYHTKSSMMINGKVQEEFLTCWQDMLDMIQECCTTDPSILNDRLKEQLLIISHAMMKGEPVNCKKQSDMAIQGSEPDVNNTPSPQHDDPRGQDNNDVRRPQNNTTIPTSGSDQKTGPPAAPEHITGNYASSLTTQGVNNTTGNHPPDKQPNLSGTQQDNNHGNQTAQPGQVPSLLDLPVQTPTSRWSNRETSSETRSASLRCARYQANRQKQNTQPSPHPVSALNNDSNNSTPAGPSLQPAAQPNGTHTTDHPNLQPDAVHEEKDSNPQARERLLREAEDQIKKTKTELQGREMELKAKERQLNSLEKVLQAREKELDKRQSQYETAKSCITGYERKIKELEDTNRMLMQRLQAAPSQTNPQPQSEHTAQNHSAHTNSIHQPTTMNAPQIEVLIQEKLSSMEHRITTSQSQQMTNILLSQLIQQNAQCRSHCQPGVQACHSTDKECKHPPDRARRHSPGRSRGYSPDRGYRYRYSPDRRSRYTPDGGHREYRRSPDRGRELSADRDRGHSTSRRRRHSSRRRRHSGRRRRRSSSRGHGRSSDRTRRRSPGREQQMLSPDRGHHKQPHTRLPSRSDSEHQTCHRKAPEQTHSVPSQPDKLLPQPVELIVLDNPSDQKSPPADDSASQPLAHQTLSNCHDPAESDDVQPQSDDVQPQNVEVQPPSTTSDLIETAPMVSLKQHHKPTATAQNVNLIDLDLDFELDMIDLLQPTRVK